MWLFHWGIKIRFRHSIKNHFLCLYPGRLQPRQLVQVCLDLGACGQSGLEIWLFPHLVAVLCLTCKIAGFCPLVSWLTFYSQFLLSDYAQVLQTLLWGFAFRISFHIPHRSRKDLLVVFTSRSYLQTSLSLVTVRLSHLTSGFASWFFQRCLSH